MDREKKENTKVITNLLKEKNDNKCKLMPH
jgi:hypothetical protein